MFVCTDPFSGSHFYHIFDYVFNQKTLEFRNLFCEGYLARGQQEVFSM